MSLMTVPRPVFCQLKSDQPLPPEIQKSVRVVQLVQSPSGENGKIVLQPRICTLRSYGGGVMIKTKKNHEMNNQVSSFFETLSDYIESSKKSQEFEIVSGRLAMIVFAAAISMEVATGNSIFRKMDLQGIAEAGGVCLAAIASAATFAYFSSARNRVGEIFTVTSNTFIDSLIDQIIDGLFYEIDYDDLSEEI